MLRFSLDRPAAADAVEQAVGAVLADGIYTRDLTKNKAIAVSTAEMGDAVVKRIGAVP